MFNALCIPCSLGSKNPLRPSSEPFTLSIHSLLTENTGYILIAPRLEKSRSQRVLWLLEELKIDYDLKTFKRVNMLAPKELKDIHPLGKSPVITVESEATAKPTVLAESGFIIEYLVENFGPWLAPEKYHKGKDGQVGAETEEWVRYRYFMHYGEGSLMPLLVMALVFNSKEPNHNISIGAGTEIVIQL